MEQLPHYVVLGENAKVCHFHYGIYGLKKSPRVWFMKFSQLIICYMLTACKVNPILFHNKKFSRNVIHVVYVDDSLITNNDTIEITYIKTFLNIHLII